MNLDSLQATLKSSGGVLQLPLIKNKKTVNPRCAMLGRAARLAFWQSTPGHCSYMMPHLPCMQQSTLHKCCLAERELTASNKHLQKSSPAVT